MSLPAYREYKKSGVSWIGSIPKEWDMWKISHACPYVASGTTPKTESDDYYGGENLWVTTGELRETLINDTQKKVTDQALIDIPTLRKHPKGSVAIAMYGATIGRLGIFGKPATTNQACCVMPPSKILHNKFLYYWLYATRQEIINLSSGGGQPNVNQEKIASLKVSAPKFEEQTQIANFLDRETAKIDTLIEKQKRLIKLLKEKRQAVISHAVRVRDGDTSSKLSHYVTLTSGFAFSSADFSHNPEDTRLLRGANVGVGSLKWNDNVYWNTDDFGQFKEYQLKVGDVVFGMDRPWISAGARVSTISETDVPSLLVQRVARLRGINGLSQQYLYLLLSSNEFRSYVEADLTGVSVPHISPDQITGFTIRVLKKESQAKLCAEVERKLTKIDATIAASKDLIKLSNERRSALISAAVTGKFDVRSAA